MKDEDLHLRQLVVQAVLPSDFDVHYFMSNVQWDVLTSTCFSFASFSVQFVPNNRPVASTQLSAEWAPSDGKWEDKDFENDIKKLEKEDEERLDAKISEMMANVEKTGK